MNLLLSLILILTLLNSSESKSVKAKPGIVDGGGYTLSNSAFPSDLVMQANPVEGGGQLGQVTLEPSDNSPGQKWAVAYYGSTASSFTSGANRNNIVSAYYPNGSSSSRERQYTFESDDENETFQVKNKETGLCLSASKRESIYFIEFGECNELNGQSSWIFQRNG